MMTEIAVNLHWRVFQSRFSKNRISRYTCDCWVVISMRASARDKPAVYRSALTELNSTPSTMNIENRINADRNLFDHKDLISSPAVMCVTFGSLCAQNVFWITCSIHSVSWSVCPYVLSIRLKFVLLLMRYHSMWASYFFRINFPELYMLTCKFCGQCLLCQ
jgi:hypothetical protein